jgi:uncharacterized membrane protein HdeD (DUF308 family)
MNLIYVYYKVFSITRQPQKNCAIIGADPKVSRILATAKWIVFGPRNLTGINLAAGIEAGISLNTVTLFSPENVIWPTSRMTTVPSFMPDRYLFNSPFNHQVMPATPLKTIKESINYWWLFLLTGVLLIVVGLWVFASPLASYLSLSLIFSLGILFTGIFEIIFAITNRSNLDSWGWTLAGGILDVVIGGYLLAYPAISMSVLPFILGFWLLFRGFSAIGSAFDMKSYGDKNWGWFLFLGIGIVFFGVMVLANPAFGVANIIIWTAFAFIFAGVFRIYLALKLRKLKKAIL